MCIRDRPCADSADVPATVRATYVLVAGGCVGDQVVRLTIRLLTDVPITLGAWMATGVRSCTADGEMLVIGSESAAWDAGHFGTDLAGAHVGR